jgi:hypothetical protein
LVSKERLKSLFTQPGLSKTERLLLLLAHDVAAPKKAAEIRTLGAELGLLEIERWNVDTFLHKSRGKATKLKDGWVLTTEGKHHLGRTFDLKSAISPANAAALQLRTLISKLKDDATKAFVDEAIRCLEVSPPLLRAAVVLSWVGATSVLQTHVVKEKLKEFNAEASARDPKWKSAKTTDDLGLMKEDAFLDVLQKISVIGKNVKQELKDCLKLRNGSGHPNSLVFGENRVASHVEILMLNVFSKFDAEGKERWPIDN